MSEKRKVEYVIYNKYDTRGPILLDEKTKDIQLSGWSSIGFLSKVHKEFNCA